MIREHQGQYHSERTFEEDLELLQADIAGLSETERALLEAVLKEAQEGETGLMDLLFESLYEHDPVPMDVFLDDPYYLGKSTRSLFPTLREDLLEIDERGYREVILGGALGTGKSTGMSIGIARMIYKASCLIDPQRAYGLQAGSKMFIVLVTKSLQLAKDVMKSKVDSLISNSPYFMENFRPQFKDLETVFPHNIRLVCGSIRSAGNRITGRDVIGGAMDESNLMGKLKAKKVIKDGERRVVKTDVAEEIYSTLINRITSRGNYLPGVMFLVSSKTTSDAFLDRRIRESKDNPLVFVKERAQWDVRPPETEGTFRVLVGGASMPSRILGEDEQEPPQNEMDRHGAFVIEVPIDYRPHFELDLEESIREIAGRATASLSAYIYRTEKIDDSVDGSMEHPFSSLEWDFDDKDQEIVWELICNKEERKVRAGVKEITYRPKINPRALRAVHFDQSLSGDSFGVCMGHIDRWVEVERVKDKGDKYTELKPRIIIDFMLRINPPFTGDIRLSEVRWIVYDFIEHGYNVARFSADSFQSADALQAMRDHGVKSDLLSVDRKPDAYEALKNAFYDDRIVMYRYDPVIDEIKTLERNALTGTIDHPKGGSKDVADAMAAVVYNLERMARTMTPVVSASMGAATGMNSQGEGGSDDHSWVFDSDLKPVGNPGKYQQAGRSTSAGPGRAGGLQDLAGVFIID